MDNQRYCLVSDDDGHWYVVPADKRLESYEYFEKIYKYWEEMPEDEEEPDEPEWLDPVNGSLSFITFENYKIGIG